MIEFQDVTVYYPKSNEPALSHINLTFQQGEFVCVLGPSGAGKSTMIRTVNALQPVTAGNIFIDGQDLDNWTSLEKRQWRSRTGMIFQHFHLIPRLSVEQNVLTGLFGYKHPMAAFAGVFSQSEKKKARSILQQVGLGEMAERRVEWLSGGQKQRVGVARALMQEPDVFLGDEPVASLDPGTAQSIFALLKDVHVRNDLTTIINVHDVALARSFATRIVGLSHGKVIFDGKPDELTESGLEHIYGTVLQA
ncbi:phosphonate transport system ATP-binding protein [Alteribacillus persepolensis]|uniref:Phosphonate transport system ATP-binding protein n=1 Tax=Alteribacillus persepolensis TaxID=568899 RepID=A0A1G7YYE4_9BACI|nr:phosphonate ABC transporter ATP-binding protein [Alteribacillus persepolensis]SDH01471.1 phosphonate transport system ATP-binding protein [Alteribacillus persepolensis]